MGGTTVTRSTTGTAGPGGSGAATKRYVDASIAITPHTATNEVGDAHVFTITYTAMPGSAGAPSGFAITPSLSPSTGLTQNATTCANPSVNGNVATCTYTINSNTTGTYTLDATGSSTMAGVTVTRSTTGNAGPGGSTGATKHYVDASIAITPLDATNVVGNAHTFTITLTAIPGGAGAPNGFSITPAISPTTGLTQNANTCASPSVNGIVATCTYTINSSTVGTYTLNASGSVTIGGVTVTRSTSGNAGPGGSGPATKHYVAPNSSLVKAERDVTTPDTTQNGGGFAAGPITANPLDVLEYQLTYTNNGVGSASQVTVTDVVSVEHAGYVASSCAGGNSCSYDPGSHTITWHLGTVNGDGTSVVLTFQVKLTNDFPAGVQTQVTNSGTVTTAEEGSKPSNTVVANVFQAVQAVQPVQAVQSVLAASTPALPKAGTRPIDSNSRSPWIALGLGALCLVALAGILWQDPKSRRLAVRETDRD